MPNDFTAKAPFSLNSIIDPYMLSNNLSMRSLVEADARELFLLTDQNRLYLRRYLPWLDSCTLEQHSLDFIKVHLKEAAALKSLVLALILEDKLIGVVGFNKIDWQKNEAVIGYWLAEACQGKGYMTQACQGLLDIGFCHLKLEKIYLECNVSNTKSQAVAERLDFPANKVTIKEGKLYGGPVNLKVYEMGGTGYYKD